MTNTDFDTIPQGNGDVFDPDAPTNPVEADKQLYRVYEGSRIAVGAGTGKWWKRIFDAASTAYQPIWDVWDQVFAYYNNNQNKSLDTPRGVFKRGDGTENVVYSNINTVLPAVYSKNPDVTCSTTDQGDQAFCDALEQLLNTLIKRRDKLNAKAKIKRAVGFGLLTNQGCWKLGYTAKDDSREMAREQMQVITDQLAQEKDPTETERLYGELQALEMNMEVLEASGVSMNNVLPHNLIIDPNAEQPDGLDGNYMIERCFLPTAALIARFTKEDPESDDVNSTVRTLVYKPTHKAVFADGQGKRDDGLGLVMQAFAASETPTQNTIDERSAYIDMLHTECFYVWDKTTRRVMLYHRDDWTWPLWVWDDPLKLTRFFPYFIISYEMSTGGTTNVGAVAYYLDQQDEINDINRQINKIRRTIFDFFFYNSEAMSPDEAEKFVDALRGVGSPGNKHMIGVKAGEGGDVSKMIQSFLPPSAQHEAYFSTQRSMDAINRITNTSDALRGVQFKTNTNVDAVNTYQESMRLSVGAKVDVVEDVVADFAEALAEICIQHYTTEEVIALVGPSVGQGWQQMSLDQFKSTYSLEIAAGSMEKPNSVFKKKEAVEIVQAVGQFANAAPGASLRIMLKVLEQAFTEVVVKPEDWAALDQEIAATSQKGSSTPQQGGQPQPEGGGGDAMMQQLQALPTEVKAHVMQMKQQGASNEQIKTYLMQQIQQPNQSKGTVQ
jgi:hypothetical protein